MRLPARVAQSRVAQSRVARSRVVEYRGLRLGLLVAVRLLLFIGLVVLGCRALAVPHDRPLGDLEQSLASGQVDSVTVEEPPLPGVAGVFEVRWSTGPLHVYLARYSIAAGGRNPVLTAVTASPRHPRVTVTRDPFTVDPRLQSGLGLGFVIGVGVLVLLVFGPAPALATRWAWFWLGSIVPVTAALFLLLESAPLWRPLDPLAARRPLTGWPAFLGALVLAAVGRTLFPALTGVFWSRG